MQTEQPIAVEDEVESWGPVKINLKEFLLEQRLHSK